jgi:hypothetical protein
MVLTKSAKRLVACIASVFLLSCQAASAAQVCLPSTPPAADSATIEPCHEATHPSGDTQEHAQPHGCPAQYASAGVTKIDTPQAVDLPGVDVPPRWISVPPRDGRLAVAPPARAEPPPLTILHCRLLI